MLKKPKRIGLIIDSIEDECEYEICKAIISFLENKDAQFLIFECVHNFQYAGIENQYIKTEEMIRYSNMDGLIIFTAYINEHFEGNQLSTFLNSLPEIPKVCIGEPVDEYPSIVSNNIIGLERLLDHLIIDHGCTRYCLICGESTNYDSKQRLTSISNYMSNYNISFSERNIIKTEEFTKQSGRLCAAALLENTLITPEVILCFDDYLALGVIDYLLENGFKVPEDIIVTGFDNISEASQAAIPLTTIKQPFDIIGNKAAELISMMIENYSVPKRLDINTELVIRKSCGCDNYPYNTYRKLQKSDKNIQKTFKAFIKYIQDATLNIPPHLKSGSIIIIQLLYSMDFENELDDFKKVKKHISAYIIKNVPDNKTADSIKSAIKFFLLLCQSLQSSCYCIILQYVIDAINDQLYLNQTMHYHKNRNIQCDASINSQILLRADSLDELKSKLPNFIKYFKIDSFFMFLYKNNSNVVKKSTDESIKFAEQVFGYCSGKDVLNNESVKFETVKLLPSWDIIGYKNNYIYFMLFYKNDPIGYVFMDCNLNDFPQIYGALRINMETAFSRIILIEEIKERAKQKDNYNIRIFRDLKNIFTLIINNFNIHKKKYQNSDEMNSLGLNILRLKDRLNYYFNTNEVILNFEYSKIIDLSNILEMRIRELVDINQLNIEYQIQKNIFIQCDQFAIEFIIDTILEGLNDFNNCNKNHYSLTLDLKRKAELKITCPDIYISEKELNDTFNFNLYNSLYHEYKSPFTLKIAAVKRVLEQMKSSIIIKNSVKEGLIITINIPNVDYELDLSNKETSKSIEKNEINHKKSILLIDNDNHLKSFLVKSLSDEYNFITENNDIDINTSGNIFKKISLIIINGNRSDFFFIKKFYNNSNYRYIPILVISSDSTPKNRIAALSLGCIDYIVKPFNINYLRQKIKNLFMITDYRQSDFTEKFEKSIMKAIESDMVESNNKKGRIASILSEEYKLTKREIEIVQNMRKGFYHKQVAAELNISEQTVKNISHAIYKKCEVSSKKDLLKLLVTIK